MLAKPLVSFAALTMFVLATPAVARAGEAATPTHGAHAPHHVTAEHGAHGAHGARTTRDAHASNVKGEAAKAQAAKPKVETHIATKTETKVETKTETKLDTKVPPAVAIKAATPPSAAEVTLDEIRAALAGKRSDRTTLPDLPASVSVPMETDSDEHDAKALESDPHGTGHANADANANAKAEKAEKKSDGKSDSKSDRKHGAKVEAPRTPAKAQPSESEPGQKRKRDSKSPARGRRGAPKPGVVSGGTV